MKMNTSALLRLRCLSLLSQGPQTTDAIESLLEVRRDLAVKIVIDLRNLGYAKSIGEPGKSKRFNSHTITPVGRRFLEDEQTNVRSTPENPNPANVFQRVVSADAAGPIKPPGVPNSIFDTSSIPQEPTQESPTPRSSGASFKGWLKNRAAVESGAPRHVKVKRSQPSQQPDDAFRCALFDDGALLVQVGSEKFELSAVHTQYLFQYTDLVRRVGSQA